MPWWAVVLIALGAYFAGALTMAIAAILDALESKDEETRPPIIGKRFRGIE